MLTVMLILLMAALCLTACNDGECKHVFSPWKTTREATCTVEGERTRTCRECGMVQTSAIAMTAHVETLVDAAPATCEDDGYSGDKVCDVCGAMLEAGHPIASLGHALGAFQHEMDGETHIHVAHCSRCSYFESEECDIKEESRVANCVLGGYRRISCAECGFAQTLEETVALGHDYDYEHASFNGESAATHTVQCKRDGCGQRITVKCAGAVNKVDPTCEDEGYDAHTCDVCGGQWKDNFVKERGHDYSGEWYEFKKADCHNLGQQRKDCSRCDKYLTKDIPMTSHDFSVWKVGRDATCTLEGYEQKTCSICGDTNGETKVIPLKDHTYGWVTVEEPTCTTTGTKEERCSSCGLRRGDPVTLPTVAHVYGEWVYDIRPSCTVAGHKTRICTVCHIAKEEADEPAPGHKPKSVEDKQPTCTEDGYRDRTVCSVCARVLTGTVLAKLGHAYKYTPLQNVRAHSAECDRCHDKIQNQPCSVVAADRRQATCTEPGYTRYECKDCKDSYIVDNLPIGHNFGDYTNYVEEEGGKHIHWHSRKCRRDGCGFEEKEQCTEELRETFEATCTLAGYDYYTCAVCKHYHEEINSPAKGHDFSDGYQIDENGGVPMHYQVCKTCGSETERMFCDITYVGVDPTCVSAGYTQGTCTVCGHTDRHEVAEAFGHEYGPWQYDGDDDPSDDATHTHSKYCVRCSDRVQQPCDIQEDIVLPTCTAGGVTHRACKDCQMSFDGDIVTSLGHNWDEKWHVDEESGEHYRACLNDNCGAEERFEHKFNVTITPASCVQDRQLHNECSVCAYVKDETEQGTALGHSWGEWTITENRGFDALGTHTRECLTCGEQDDEHNGAHDYSSSNICSQCGHDGLVYRLEGEHYLVESDNNVYKGNASSLTAPGQGAAHIVIPSEHRALGEEKYLPVVGIVDNAFINNNVIVDVSIPSTVEEIGKSAFQDCSKLTSITLEGESALNTIGDYAFWRCASLAEFVAPNALEYIGAGAFRDCSALVRIDIADGVTHIGSMAFSFTGYLLKEDHWEGDLLYIGNHLINARMLSEDGKIEVRQGTVSINAEAFKYVDVISLVLPNTLRVVEADAFAECLKLNSVEFKGTLQEWLSIDFVNEYSSPLAYDATFHIDGASGDIIIPDGVTRIPAGTFRGTPITSVHIPDSVTWIGAEAFEDCAQLAEIFLTDNLVYIGKDAFKGTAYYNDNWQDGLLYVGNHLIAADGEIVKGDFVMDDRTVTVGVEAFKGCEQLTSVTFGANVVRIGANVFAGCKALERVMFADATANWFAQGVIGRYLKGASLAGDPKGCKNSFDFYNGEWKRY